MTGSTSIQNLAAQVPNAADLQGIARDASQWAAGGYFGYLILGFIVVSFLYNVILYKRKKHLEVKVALEGALIRKLQAELKAEKVELAKTRKTVEVQGYKLEEQRKLLEKSSVAAEMRRIEKTVESKYGTDETNRGYWDRLGDVDLKPENPRLKKLVEEKGEVEGMLEITKMKYHTRAIDEKNFSNITEEYQKRLIEIESKIKKIQEEETASTGIAQPPPERPQPTFADATEPGVDYDIRAQLEPRLMGMEKSGVVLISAKSEDQNRVISNLLRILVVRKGMAGVYISVSRPYEGILATMDSASIPKDRIHFIDCISQMTGKLQQDAGENVTFVENPSSLEEVSMHLDRTLAKIKSPGKFIILDSLSSLLIYNNDKSVKEFAHFLINRIRLENISGVILSVEKKEAEDMVKTLTPMCDAEIRF